MYQILLENSRKKNFIRIFPSEGSNKYLSYMRSLPSLDASIYKILYEEGQTQSSFPSVIRSVKETKRPDSQMTHFNIKRAAYIRHEPHDSTSALPLQGIELLIEYLKRVLLLVSSITIEPYWSKKLSSFLQDEIWGTSIAIDEAFAEALKLRIKQLIQQKRQSICSNDSNSVMKRMQLITALSHKQIESLLKKNLGNISLFKLANGLFDDYDEGILTYLHQKNMNKSFNAPRLTTQPTHESIDPPKKDIYKRCFKRNYESVFEKYLKILKYKGALTSPKSPRKSFNVSRNETSLFFAHEDSHISTLHDNQVKVAN
jgi:hypothetical protein